MGDASDEDERHRQLRELIEAETAEALKQIAAEFERVKQRIEAISQEAIRKLGEGGGRD